MDSSCLPAGFSYLTGLAMGLAFVVLSSWIVQQGRAVYREDGGFRSGLWNASPLWVPALTGIVTLFALKDWLVNWVNTCLPAGGWSVPGTLFIGLGAAVALTAAGRLVVGRIRVGKTEGLGESGDEAEPQRQPVGAVSTEMRPRKLPLGRRRVIVEYALTYGAAVIVILIGVGLA